MKKILFTIAIVLTIVFNANAQKSDWFVRDFDAPDRTWDDGTLSIILVQGGVGEHETDQSALPLGNGLIILATLGAGYALRRAGKKE